MSLILGLFVVGCGQKESGSSSAKPVLLYSNYYNAEGENRYPADGRFGQVLSEFGKDFEIRVHSEPITPETLSDVKVLLIVNPNVDAVEGHPAPPHVNAAEIATIKRFVENGGGLITAFNQNNHNLETVNMNRLLSEFGMRITDDYTDAKAFQIPEDAPIIGGLLWAYIIGDSIVIDPSHSSKPFSVVTNDLSQKPINGDRDAEGILLAASTPGKGRVITVTDSGWLIDAALNGEEAGGVVIENNDNREIASRLARWAAGM